MSNTKSSKVITSLAIAIMLGCVLVVAIGLVVAFTGYGLPESWQYYETYYVVDMFWIALIASIFIFSLVIFTCSNSIARLFSK